jgi:hypothetical protein
MRRKRSAGTVKVAAECSFCNEGGPERLLVSDHHGIVFICEACVAMAAAGIAEARCR